MWEVLSESQTQGSFLSRTVFDSHLRFFLPLYFNRSNFSWLKSLGRCRIKRSVQCYSIEMLEIVRTTVVVRQRCMSIVAVPGKENAYVFDTTASIGGWPLCNLRFSDDVDMLEITEEELHQCSKRVAKTATGSHFRQRQNPRQQHQLKTIYCQIDE